MLTACGISSRDTCDLIQSRQLTPIGAEPPRPTRKPWRASLAHILIDTHPTADKTGDICGQSGFKTTEIHNLHERSPIELIAVRRFGVSTIDIFSVLLTIIVLFSHYSSHYVVLTAVLEPFETSGG